MRITMSTKTREIFEEQETGYDEDRSWEQRNKDILAILAYSLAARIVVTEDDKLLRFELTEAIFKEVCRVVDEFPDGPVLQK